MKSIADGGLCHQFHYAGVVTKIISMIDEMATRRHAETMPDARADARHADKFRCFFFLLVLFDIFKHSPPPYVSGVK